MGFTLFPPTLLRQDTIHRLCNAGSLKGECGCCRPCIPESDVLQKRQGTGSGTCTTSGRAPSQAMEMLQPYPTSSGTTGCGAKQGLVSRGRSTWTQQGEQAGTVHSHSSPMPPGETGTSGGKTSLAEDHRDLHTAKTGENGNEIQKLNSNLEIPKQRVFFYLPLAADAPRYNTSTNYLPHLRPLEILVVINKVFELHLCNL